MNGIALLDINKRVFYYVLFFSTLLGIFKISAFIKAFFKKFYLDDTDKKGKYADTQRKKQGEKPGYF